MNKRQHISYHIERKLETDLMKVVNWHQPPILSYIHDENSPDTQSWNSISNITLSASSMPSKYWVVDAYNIDRYNRS